MTTAPDPPAAGPKRVVDPSRPAAREQGAGATTVTLTGTGIPRVAPGRAGPGVLLRSGDHQVQVDAGRATALRIAEAGSDPGRIDALLITHHHSDHLTGLADLVIARWVHGNHTPLPVIVPAGPATEFVDGLLQTWADDITLRVEHSGVPVVAPSLDVRAFVAGPDPVEVFTLGDLRVSSVAVHHEPVVPAVAFRIDAPDGSVVISGDTIVCDELESLAAGCDVLVHEAARATLLRDAGRPWIADYHADAVAVGALAARLGVRLLMLTHLVPVPRTPEAEQGFVDDVRAGGYAGPLVVGRDLVTAELASATVLP